MGATIAFRTANSGYTQLRHFNDTIVAKIVLPRGNWIILGRVVLWNSDGDPQGGTARIVHQANVVIDHVSVNLIGAIRHPIFLQTTLSVEEQDTVTLDCNTYDGAAEFPSLMAFDVDSFEVV